MDSIFRDTGINRRDLVTAHCHGGTAQKSRRVLDWSRSIPFSSQLQHPLLYVMIIMKLLVLLLLARVALLCLARPLGTLAGPDKIAEFGASIFISGEWDYRPDSAGRSRCTDMVDRAAEYTMSGIQFYPTAFWWDEGPLDPPPEFDPTCRKSDLSTYYCYNRFNTTRVAHWCYSRNGRDCPPVNSTQIEQLVAGLGACMKYAVSKGLNIAINARVDDGRALGGWRNTLSFDPLERYGNYSYLEAVLFPLADTVGSAMNSTTRVDFTVQGEMGATAFFHPVQWVAATAMLRERILQEAGAPPEWESNVKIGIGMNNNKMCGCINIGITDAREYLGNFSAAFNPMRTEFDMEGIHFLFNSVDFVGLSAYVPMTTPWFEVCELEGLMERFDVEAAYYNLSLAQLSNNGVGIHWTEYGVGGGSSSNGDKKANTAKEAAYYPFWGVWGEYTCDMDPFEMCWPDKPSPARDYRRYFYNHTAEYLQMGGCNYKVDQVFIWDLNSWDALAIYPLSSSSEGSYRDPVVVETVNSHNALAQALASEMESGWLELGLEEPTYNGGGGAHATANQAKAEGEHVQAPAPQVLEAPAPEVVLLLNEEAGQERAPTISDGGVLGEVMFDGRVPVPLG